MRIVADGSGDYPDGPTVKINLTRFNQPDNETVLFYGYNSVFNQDLREEYKNYKKKILLNLWMPTEYNGDPPILSGMTDYQPDGKFVEYFDVVYSICPYTIDWINQMTGDNRYKFIWHPFASPRDYNGPELSYQKIYDVCYFGGIHGRYHEEIAHVVREYGGRISYIYPNQYTTDVGLTHHGKMQMAANSKITVVINQCPLSSNHINSITRYKNWSQNKAFDGLNFDIPTVPQYKCRTAEAAYARSVILVKRDQWNIIENFFDLDEFVYFDDMEDLRTKINYILSHYDEYQPMLEKAYLRSLNMDGEGTFKKIKENENV